MRRHLPRLLLTGALLSPVSLYALGLGEIRLNSALNQPFDADIEIVAPTREELTELKVGLASNDLFTRYGLDRPAYLSNFQFAVARNRDGSVSIKVTSNRSVTEPFVTLLVEASWGRGRLLREYTVLLDPPVFTPTQPQASQPVTAPQSGAQTEGRVERAPQPKAEAAPEPTQPVPAPEPVRQEPAPRPAAAPAAVGGSYEVERNDTLYRIARSVAPDASPSALNQTMIALFRANPEAFSGSNINRLRAGSILRIPDAADIQSVSRTEATAEVARQQEAWSSAPRTDGAAEPDRLRLVTPAEAPPAATAAAAAPAKPAEAPAAASAGTAAGTAAATADKRLQVTSPGLANVQQNSAEIPPAQSTPEQQPAAEAPEAAQPPVAEQTPPAEAQPASPKPRPAAQPTEQPAEPSLLERIGDLWWVPIVAGLLLVVGLILAFLKRRRETSDLGSLDAFAPAFEPSLPAVPVKSRDRADSFLVQSNDLEEVEDPPLAGFDDEPEPLHRPEPIREAAKPRAEAAVAESKPLEDTLSSETAVHFDQQDALAEADFHMAYGLYDQAADLVKIAIEREPARRDLKLKLLEIYFVWGNRDLFLDTARDLYETRDQSAPGEWDKVLIMGKQIAPEDQMFKGETGARVDLVDVNLEGGENRVDLDLFAEPGNDQPEGLDLEFGSGERKATPPAGLAATDSSSSAASDLDFLLDEPAARAPPGVPMRLSADDEPTREIDPLARTQETPTIESPMIDRASQTMSEKIDSTALAKAGTDQTAEVSLDELGLDVDALETTGALEQTASLEQDPADDVGGTGVMPALRDDELTQLAPSLGSFERTMEAPHMAAPAAEKFDIGSTGTIFIDQVDLAGGDTVEQPRPDIDSTAAMVKPSAAELDVDLDNFAEPASGDTVRHTVSEADQFSDDVFTERTSQFAKIDLDVGEALSADDHAPTNKQVVNEMELSELEPVTMSEVGTKLDLARAYMDMGDPDGARSILEEVLQEGTSNQKQEAQRLLDSIR